MGTKTPSARRPSAGATSVAGQGPLLAAPAHTLRSTLRRSGARSGDHFSFGLAQATYSWTSRSADFVLYPRTLGDEAPRSCRFPRSTELLLPGAAHEVAHLIPQFPPALLFRLRQPGQFLRVADAAQLRVLQPVPQPGLDVHRLLWVVHQNLGDDGQARRQPVPCLGAPAGLLVGTPLVRADPLTTRRLDGRAGGVVAMELVLSLRESRIGGERPGIESRRVGVALLVVQAQFGQGEQFGGTSLLPRQHVRQPLVQGEQTFKLLNP